MAFVLRLDKIHADKAGHKLITVIKPFPSRLGECFLVAVFLVFYTTSFWRYLPASFQHISFPRPSSFQFWTHH